MALRVPMKPGAITSPPLADPGYTQDEQLRARQDQLEEIAQQMNDAADAPRGIDPDALMADEELQALLAKDGSEVSDALPGYCYMWVSIEYPVSARGIAVLQLQSIGWKVVKGDDPEALEYKTVDGTRKLGDCVLLRISARQKALLDLRNEELNRRREGAHGDSVKERARRLGINVIDYSEMTSDQQKRLERRAQQEFGKQSATQKLATDFRNGTVPGVSPGA